ncbi:hypothetical protein Nmel_015336 [Mimus melanotis]
MAPPPAQGSALLNTTKEHLANEQGRKEVEPTSPWWKEGLSSAAEHLPSPLLPTLVLSPVLQLGRTAELRGTQELREPISPRWQAPASGGPQLLLMHPRNLWESQGAVSALLGCTSDTLQGTTCHPHFLLVSSHSHDLNCFSIFTVSDISLQKLRGCKINLPVKIWADKTCRVAASPLKERTKQGTM